MKFIDGVKVLNSKEITEEKFVWNSDLVFLVIVGILILLFSIILGTILHPLYIFMIFFDLFLTVVILYEGTIKVPSGKIKYQVNIDDSVYFNDFIRHYDIISYDGELFTVTEKINQKENDKNVMS